MPEAVLERAEDKILEIRVKGNRRIEANAIKARVASKPGNPFNPAQIAADVREVYGLGFFRNVRVLTEDAAGGRVVTFEVEENPVVRQVTVDRQRGDRRRQDPRHADADDRLDARLPAALREPRAHRGPVPRRGLLPGARHLPDRGAARARPCRSTSRSRRARSSRSSEIEFSGNDALRPGAARRRASRPRRAAGTRSSPSTSTRAAPTPSPCSSRTSRRSTSTTSNDGYLQVEVGEPGRLRREGREGRRRARRARRDRARASATTSARSTSRATSRIDLPALRERVRLKQGEVFNRSSLTADVEDLERYYTDRGFFYASVSPRTVLNEDLTVDVTFDVTKGELHFIREIDVTRQHGARIDTRGAPRDARRRGPALLGALREPQPRPRPQARLLRGRRVRGQPDRLRGAARPRRQGGRAADRLALLRRRLLDAGPPGRSRAPSRSRTSSAAATVCSLVVDYGSRNSRFYLSFYDPYLFGVGVQPAHDAVPHRSRVQGLRAERDRHRDRASATT